MKLNETGKNIKSKLELASFRVLHGSINTSRHEKVDRTTMRSCAVVRAAFSETSHTSTVAIQNNITDITQPTW